MLLRLLPDAIDLPQILADFAAHGYARVGRALSDEGLTALGTRIDDLMLERVRYEGMFFQRDSSSGRYEDLEFAKGWQGPSLDYRKIEKLELDPLFLAWMKNPLFERIARAVYQSSVALYRAVLFTKSENGGTALPWHQDGGAFWGIDREPVLQIWTALDDCSIDAGCVEVVPDTHRGGLVTPEGGTIPSAALQAGHAEQRALSLPAVAGDVMLIHNHVWHRSGVNTTGRRRSALSLCYMDAATKCRRKKRAPRQFVKLFD